MLVAAFAAATCLPVTLHAQETHILAPNFPDTFKVRTTTTTDMQITLPDQTGGNRTQSAHSSMAWTSDTHKTADGYHATIAIDSLNTTPAGTGTPSDAQASPASPAPVMTTTPAATASSTSTAASTTTTGSTTTSTTTTTSSTTATGPTATLSPMSMSPADMQQKVTALLKLIGNAEVSYDSRMRPVRVDNLDALKANVKNMILVAIPSQNAQQVNSIFDLFLSDITPESAATLLRQSLQSRLPYGKTLPLKTAVSLVGSPFELYGASLTVGGTATLDSWEEGKAAHLTIMTQPAQADMQKFAVDLSNTVLNKVFVAMGKNVKPEQEAMVMAMVSRMLDNTTILFASTCHVDVDLTDTALTHSDCDTNFYMQIDMKKMFTEEQLRANPNAANMKPIAVIEMIHSVSDTALIK